MFVRYGPNRKLGSTSKRLLVLSRALIAVDFEGSSDPTLAGLLCHYCDCWPILPRPLLCPSAPNIRFSGATDVEKTNRRGNWRVYCDNSATLRTNIQTQRLDPTYSHDRWVTSSDGIIKDFAAFRSSFDSMDNDDNFAGGDALGVPEWVAYEIKKVQRPMHRYTWPTKFVDYG